MDEALAEVKKLDDEYKEIKEELFRICWYMRGSITLEESYTLGFEDRTMIAGLIKENLQTTKDSGLPFF